MSTRLEKMTAVIYKARWVDGIKDGELVTDEAIAKAVLEAGFVIPQATIPTPVGTEVKTRSGGFPSIPHVKQADGTWKPKY